MLLQGSTIYSKWGYQPHTIPAVSFSKSSTGYYRVRDKGIAQDIYEARISIEDTWDTLNDIIQTLDRSKESLSISTSTGEEIFGADVSASTCELVQSGNLQRQNFKMYSIELVLRAINPVFDYTTISFNPFRIESSYTSHTLESLIKRNSYTNSFSYVDPKKNTGIFSASFTQTTEEMKTLRRHWLANIRGNAFILQNFEGITDISNHFTYPFGPASGPGPFGVRILKWSEVRENFNEWSLKIDFAKDISKLSGGSEARSNNQLLYIIQGGNGPRDINNMTIHTREL